MATHHMHVVLVVVVVAFNVPLDIKRVILETCLSRQLAALVLTTINKKTEK